jgi:hypothetical protein
MHTTAKHSKKKPTAKTEAERKALVDSLWGKYAHVKTSSEDFARRKAEEIELEERHLKSRE